MKRATAPVVNTALAFADERAKEILRRRFFPELSDRGKVDLTYHLAYAWLCGYGAEKPKGKV